jgi:hypothetical protein
LRQLGVAPPTRASSTARSVVTDLAMTLSRGTVSRTRSFRTGGVACMFALRMDECRRVGEAARQASDRSVTKIRTRRCVRAPGPGDREQPLRTTGRQPVP